MSEQENDQIAQRRAKLAALREQGNPFPNDFRPTASARTLHERYGERSGDELEREPVRVAVAGRMMSRRIMGKASFAHLQDGSGRRMQIHVRRDALPEGQYDELFRRLDIGDILGVEGTLFRTRTGELTVAAERVRLLVKSLRPLPEKFHGLADPELRYRRRYLDLLMNPESRERFETRSRIIESIRRFFLERGYLEVETPMMHPLPGGAAARPFVTHHNALDMPLYLRIAPELYLKRLVVGGIERVFEINRNFRNEGVSTQHNPEFTMLEFYEAWADYRDLMALTETLVARVAEEATGGTAIEYQGERIELAAPWERLSLIDAIVRFNPGVDPRELADEEGARGVAARRGIALEPAWGRGKVLLELFEKTAEHRLRQPTFVVGYPTEVSPLSRPSDEDPFFADRFELFIAGREIANGFSELNDPEDQAERFRIQAASHLAGDEEAMRYDADYVRALEYGLPPTGGEGIGIDRLVMLLTDAPSIRDVLLFPLLRPEG